MHGAQLAEADLSGAVLEHAQLLDADLTNADLEGVNANGQGNTQGRVTSTYWSPTLGRGIAMGRIAGMITEKRRSAEAGEEASTGLLPV